MTTRELINKEIEALSENELDELYQIIKVFMITKRHSIQPSLMPKLRKIQIDAPPDFAAHL